MSGLIITAAPSQELISLTLAKNFCRVFNTDDDALFSVLITAAREAVEEFCSRKFAIQSLLQVMDAFPYYTDTCMSQAAYPPSYYAMPMYSTTMWNYSQMIKLFYPPCIEVQGIDYTDPSGINHTLMQDVDFLLDNISEPSRIFPMPGSMWPPCFYVPNAVRIRYTAGYGSPAVDTNPVDGEIPQGAGSQPVPQRAITAMLQLIASWYENREALSEVSMKEMPQHVQMLLWSLRVIDFQPTRG
jgi:gp6-like head-tail connector protein